MDRHWTLTLVALAGIAAGFALFAVDAATLAGVVSAAGAYALVFPEFADTARGTVDAN
jgi:hypothetical protein